MHVQQAKTALMIIKISFLALRIFRMGPYHSMFNAGDAEPMAAAIGIKRWSRAGGFPFICIKGDKN